MQHKSIFKLLKYTKSGFGGAKTLLSSVSFNGTILNEGTEKAKQTVANEQSGAIGKTKTLEILVAASPRPFFADLEVLHTVAIEFEGVVYSIESVGPIRNRSGSIIYKRVVLSA